MARSSLAALTFLLAARLPPEPLRFERIAERETLDQREAVRRVHEVERERRAFNKRHFGREVDDPQHYDLVLNTGWITPEAAAGVVIAAYRAKFGRVPDRG
jgi:cytidylate kinase